MKIEYWQHERSGEVWAVKGQVAIWPLYYSDTVSLDDPRWESEAPEKSTGGL